VNKHFETNIRSALNLENQRFLADTRRKKWLWIIIGGLLITAWQGVFLAQSDFLASDSQYRQNASSGLHAEGRFVYFYYYLGWYPLATTTDPEDLTYSRDGAKKALRHPSTLRTEMGHTTRYGDLGKVWLYFPHVWIFGFNPEPNLLTANTAGFIFALITIFSAAVYIERPVLGLVLVVLAGSNPFQLYETYVRHNVFGWPIIVLLLIIGIQLPLITSYQITRKQRLLYPVITGGLLSTVCQIRSEPATIIAGVGVSYLILNLLKLRSRVLMIITLILAFTLGSIAWSSYFSHKIKQTEAMLKKIGGTPYNGPRDTRHLIWHPIWCGLGDFDQKYGYKWDDRVPAKLFETFNQDKKLKRSTGAYVYENYWDEKQYYYKTPYEIPGYTQFIKKMILHDITHDPLWYGQILLRRLKRIATKTSPLRIAMGRHYIQVNFPMYLILLPVFFLAVLSKNRLAVVLLILSLCTSITSFLIFSGKNMTMYSSYHLISASLAVTWIFEIFILKSIGKNIK